MSQVDDIGAVFSHYMGLFKRNKHSGLQGSVEITHDLRQNIARSHFG